MESQDPSGFKSIILIATGDSSVGKTSFLNFFAYNTITRKSHLTRDIEIYSKILIDQNKKRVKVQILEIGGNRYKVFVRMPIKGVSGLILMYDVTKESTFESAKKCIQEIKQDKSNSTFIILVANKIDLVDGDPSLDQVSDETARKFAEEYNIFFEETSAKLGLNVTEIIEKLIQNA